MIPGVPLEQELHLNVYPLPPAGTFTEFRQTEVLLIAPLGKVGHGSGCLAFRALRCINRKVTDLDIGEDVGFVPVRGGFELDIQTAGVFRGRGHQLLHVRDTVVLQDTRAALKCTHRQPLIVTARVYDAPFLPKKHFKSRGACCTSVTFHQISNQTLS